MKKCLILYNEPGPDALPDELDVLDQVNFIEDTLKKLDYDVSLRGITDDFFREIAQIIREKVMNLYSTLSSQ